MHNIIDHTKTLAPAALLLGAVMAVAPVHADHHAEAAVPGLLEVSGCNYLPGKGRSDLDEAFAYMESTVGDEMRSAGVFAALWEPVYSMRPTDVYYVQGGADGPAMLIGNAEFRGSDDAAAMAARFDEIVDCSPAVALSGMQIFDGGGTPPKEGETRPLETFACQLKDGRRMDDLDGPEALGSRVMTDIGAQASGWRLAPVFGAPPQLDVVYLRAHRSTTHMTETLRGAASHASAPMLAGWYGELIDCTRSLYDSTVLVMP